MADDQTKNIIQQIFGWTGTGLATYFFLSPGVLFCKLINEQIKIDEIPGILLICSFMNCILWADYGLNDNSFQVYFANGIGGCITLIWITIYLIYLGRQKLCLALLLIILLMVIVGGISSFFYFIIDKKITGFVAMIFNVLMYAAPGEKMVRVCKTKQYNLIPIFSTIGGFFCSLCWLMFGVYKGDLNLIIPNALGLFFAVLQIIIYCIFYNKKKSEENFDLDDDNLA